MANALNREIKVGERVVVRDDIYIDPTCVFICEQGFGLHAFTGSTAIIGRWENDGAEGRINGLWIDVEKTNALPKQELKNNALRYRYKQYETFLAEQQPDGRWRVTSTVVTSEPPKYYDDAEFQSLFELDQLSGSLNMTTGRG